MTDQSPILFPLRLTANYLCPLLAMPKATRELPPGISCRYAPLAIIPNPGLPPFIKWDHFSPPSLKLNPSKGCIWLCPSHHSHVQSILLGATVTTSASPKSPCFHYFYPIPDLNCCDTILGMLHFLSTTVHTILHYEKQLCH